jgi:hypothetical protein
MFRIFGIIAAFAKRLDARLTRGVDIRGRRLAGLKPLPSVRPAITGSRKRARRGKVAISACRPVDLAMRA